MTNKNWYQIKINLNNQYDKIKTISNKIKIIK